MTRRNDPPRLSALWRQIKRLLSSPPANSDSPSRQERIEANIYWRVRLLERCFCKDSTVDTARKRLERCFLFPLWEVSIPLRQPNCFTDIL